MSDDEQSPQPSPAFIPNEDGKSEAKIRMEMEAKRRKERAEEEWREYEEFRRGEREKEEEEIRQLRERRERRKMEREEEEKRLAELRQIEDQKRRAEEAQETEEEKKEEVTKSKEQLEAEKRAILEQRIQPLNISGFNADQLKNKAKELHDLICRLEGDIYDLSQRFTRQSYDMQELAERARQINKGGKAKAITNAPDPLAAKFSGIPPMVVMYSQYERVKDPRSFKDRRTVFTGANYAEEYQRIAPSHVLVMTEEGFQIAGAAEGGGHSAAPAPATEVPVE
ncbi:Troponin T, fast skeletal muscle isoform, variant 4 [Schistosoma haematobium]|uniref:Troponin T, fast skeletal muscle isoform, variant 4 n=1 Tax=Schistosoma haematobium TaxID=6185 RepID=A0A922S0N1_SCHHA|nr:Troponin T, fast skeletal muscle isoform, variant 4 [Schistosoma haematobium]KAH9588291.1 Troponin T, fast skeletal muscle isoform, variant 4 [Schistosoma haematobium]